jgi:hypothetical protein
MKPLQSALPKACSWQKESEIKSGEGVKDGMDISLGAFMGNQLSYSGAKNPLWIVRKTDLLTEEQNSKQAALLATKLH